MLIKGAGTSFFLISSFLPLSKTLLVREGLQVQPSSPVSHAISGVVAAGQQAAPPRRRNKTPPFAIFFTFLKILFLALCESELRFLKTSPKQSRSELRFLPQIESVAVLLPCLNPVRSLLAPVWFGLASLLESGSAWILLAFVIVFESFEFIHDLDLFVTVCYRSVCYGSVAAL
ncbi:hypothetical protein MtrunA17_Chr4g0034791 [Medicago truncatula]|uniref:Transmembrane protein n=1 Tax=Medicago truncatula TaxID=3880 RepID=G7JG31_MEDTR|nr:hypothetical protein MTR_4g069700 [Medicago truncatula]AES89071.1 hypothetical protein MTR_4g069720 [Medicago truncatula]RHN61273.1 hypothetical protein MtrunA17_Chr4g0034791 [Medicago truncatula]